MKRPFSILNSVGSLYDDAKIITTHIKKLLKTNTIKDSKVMLSVEGELKQIHNKLGKIEEVIAYHRGIPITVKDENLIFSYNPNFKKRFKELSSKLDKIGVSLTKIAPTIKNYENEAVLSMICSNQQIPVECNLIDKLGDYQSHSDKLKDIKNKINKELKRIARVESDMKYEMDSINALLERNKITATFRAINHVEKYKGKIKISQNYTTQLNRYKNSVIKVMDRLDTRIDAERKLKMSEVIEGSIDKTKIIVRNLEPKSPLTERTHLSGR